MNKELMIDAIYKEIADKELSFCCRFTGFHTKGVETVYFYTKKYEQIVNINGDVYNLKGKKKDRHIVNEIIGHPVLIGDVLSWLSRKDLNKIITDLEDLFTNDIIADVILELWIDKTKPIEKQSIKLISYVFDLIKKKIKN